MNKKAIGLRASVFALVIVVTATGLTSCQNQLVQNGSSSEVYTIRVDSDTVGVAYGPVQYDIGNTYLGEKQYAEAVKAYTSAIRNGYTDFNVYINRGTAYLELGLNSGAIADASTSLDMDITELKAYRLRGKAYFKSGKYSDAVADFSKAIELAPGNKEDYLGRGMALVQIAEYSRATEDFVKAISLDPKYPDAFYWRAFVSEKYKQDYVSALDDYTKVINLNGAYVYDAYNGRGETYIKLNEFGKAISDFSMLLEFDPDYWLAYYNRGLCYAGIKQYQKAVDDFKRYLALDVNNKYGEVQSADYLATYYKPFLEGYTH
ncbi:MAG: tetratricopeptide repeat protein, partial [Chloroflexi bacterium]|nr:tetratricopeptide repeat protein [Chloroflexota bacterium]